MHVEFERWDRKYHPYSRTRDADVCSWKSLAYFLNIKKPNKENPEGWKCLESCLLEIVSGPLSSLTLLSAAAYSIGFWTMRKCGEVSCICTCHFPPNVHSMSSTSLPGVIKLPFDHAANIFLCCLFAPLFRHLTPPSLSPLSDSQLVGSHVRSHTHTPTHHNVFFSTNCNGPLWLWHPPWSWSVPDSRLEFCMIGKVVKGETASQAVETQQFLLYWHIFLVTLLCVTTDGMLKRQRCRNSWKAKPNLCPLQTHIHSLPFNNSAVSQTWSMSTKLYKSC